MATRPDSLVEAARLLAVGQFRQAEQICQQVIKAQPYRADAWHILGGIAHQEAREEEALQHLRRARDLGLKTAEIFSNLGAVYGALGQRDEALAHCRMALKIDDKNGDAWGNMGILLRRQGGAVEAEAACRRAIALKPQTASFYNTLGNALADQQRFDEALENFEAALRLHANDADAHLDRSLVRLRRGEFAPAWADYEWRWRTQGRTPRTFSQPRWDGRNLLQGTILIYAEQGLGDTLQFIRYAPLVKQRVRTVVVECQRPLFPLLTGSAGIDQLIPRGDTLPAFDTQVATMSLPGAVGTALETIPRDVPYLHADPGLIEKWRATLESDGTFRIGITWQGSPKHPKDALRSVSLTHFAPVAAVKDVRLYSLQKGQGTEQLSVVRDRFPVTELGADLDESAGAFMDTAAVMRNLDLVITSDTAIAHLAGGLGVPGVVALPFLADWRWLIDRTDSPWYPTMRLFRQQSAGDWEGVFRQIATELRVTVASRGRA